MESDENEGFRSFNHEKRKTFIEPRFECPICLNCLKEPILTKCGHRFCKECILDWIRKKKGERCPVDLNKIEECDLFPDNYTRREITQQMVQCSFSGCDAITPLLDFEKHLIENHEDKNTSNLPSNLRDGIAQDADSWDAPPKGSCSSQIQLIKNLYERVVQLEQKQRVSELLLEEKTKQEEKTKLDLEKLILKLEQKTRDLEFQLNSSRVTLNNMLMEKEQFLSHLPLKICNGSHVWNVTHFRQKLLAMSREPSEMFYSDGFYTSYLGYKFCARLNLSPNNHSYLSLLVHLMKSENDYILSWPFKGRISFKLVHPISQELSMSEVMCTKSGLKAFEKPVASLSPRAFGYTEFALTDNIINRGYINDDGSVNIKIEISCI